MPISPLPWRVSNAEGADGSSGVWVESDDGESVCDFYYRDNGPSGHLHQFFNAKENAEFVVSLAESHDALLDACKSLLNYMGPLNRAIRRKEIEEVQRAIKEAEALCPKE